MNTIRHHVTEWLTANNIDPESIPNDAVPVVVGGRVRIRAYRRTADGHLVIPAGQHWPAKTDLDVPLLVEPPATISRWITGEIRGFALDAPAAAPGGNRP